MSSDKRICRRCFLEESGEVDVLADIRSRIENIPPALKTEEAAYQKRLAACGSCDHLVGGVCMKCGCYPEFRAAFRKNRCPDPVKKAW